MSGVQAGWRNWAALAVVPWLAPAPLLLATWAGGQLPKEALLYGYLIMVAPLVVWSVLMGLVLLFCRRNAIVLSRPRIIGISVLVLALLCGLRAAILGPEIAAWTDSPYDGLLLHSHLLSLSGVAELVRVLLVCGAVGGWCGIVLVLLRYLAARTPNDR